MKIITYAVIIMILNGCYYQITDKTDILKSEQFCKDKGGVKNIQVDFLGGEKVACLDGDRTWLSKVKLMKQVK